MHVIAAKAVAFKEAMTEAFAERQRQTVANSRALAQALQERGYSILTGGTDNHLFLVDLTNKGLSGKEAASRLGEAAITVNKNLIPFDTRSPFETSGIRLGTAASTTRGMKEPEMAQIAQFIDQILLSPKDEETKKRVKKEVHELCETFPIYEQEALAAL